MRHILVAVDDSDASERVRDFVNDFFVGLDVTITAVNVGGVPLPWVGYAAAPGAVGTWSYPPAAMGAVATDVEMDLARQGAEHTVEASGVRADDEVITLGGDVAEELRRLAAERDVDVLVVGSNHRSLFDRLLAPSVSTGLAKDAPCPVLVVH